MFYHPFIDTQSGFDVFSSAFDDTYGDPFIDPVKTMLEYSGKNDSDDIYFIHDLTACRTSSCTIGFRLTSDADTQLSGIGIPLLIVSTLENAGNTYDIFSGGTSMAAPHVAGVVALVRAYNPDYTYSDSVAAIKQGGEYLSVLAGITSTSNAVNAMGSLSFINPPTGVVASIQ